MPTPTPLSHEYVECRCASMSSKICMVFIAGTLLLGGGLIRADKNPADQKNLENEQKQIDTAARQSGGTVAKELSDKFELHPELIQQMKDKGSGWGEITIILSMADQLTKMNPRYYPTYGEALKKIRSLRGDNSSYEKIAKHMDFNLSPVIEEVRQIRIHLQGEKRLPG